MFVSRDRAGGHQASNFNPPQFTISRSNDHELVFDPPSGSKELAEALSFRFPALMGLENKMRAAIGEFLKTAEPEKSFPGIIKNSHIATILSNSALGEEHHSKSKVQILSSISAPTKHALGELKSSTDASSHASMLTTLEPSKLTSKTCAEGEFQILQWDPRKEISKPLTRKRSRRKFEDEEKKRISQNRRMVCDDHRRRKITCNPDICPQNKQNHYKTPSMAVSRHLDLPHGREGLFEETRNPCNASDQETAVQIEQEKRQNESRQNSIAESSGRNSSATLTTPTDNPSDKASHLAGEEFEASLLQSSEQIYNFSEPLQHHHPSKPPTPLDPKSSDNLEDAGNTLGVKQDPNLSRPTTTTLLSPVVNHDSMSGLSSVQQKDIAAQSRISTLMNQNPLFNQNSFTINPTDLLPPGNAPQINYSNATNLVSSLTQSTSISPYQWHSPGLGFTSIPQVDNDNRFITPPPPMSPLQFQANPLSLDTPIADLHPEYFQYTFPDYDYTLYETLHPKSDEARGPLSSMDSPYSLSSDDMSTLSKPIVVPKSLSPVAPSLSLKHIQPMGSFSSDLTVSTQPSLSCGILSSMTTSENGQDGTELIPHCGDTMSLLSSSTSPTSIPSPAKIRLRPRRRGRPAKHRTISQENYSITSHMDNNNTIPSTPYEYTVLDAPLLMKYPSLMWKPSLGQQQTMRGDTRTHKENLDEATATTGLEAANQPRYTEQDSSPAQVGKYFSISGFNGKQYKKLDLEEAGDVPGLKNFGSLAIGSKVG